MSFGDRRFNDEVIARRLEHGFSCTYYWDLTQKANSCLLSTYRWESTYDPVFVRDWMVANPWCPIIAVTLYGIFIAAGKAYFNGRPAWNWRNSMALWNLGLALFSAIGFARTAPQLLHNLFNYGMSDNLCFDPESHFGSGATGFWVQMFCLSKFPYVLWMIGGIFVCGMTRFSRL